MLYGILSDIHGNLEAILAVKNMLQQMDIEKILVLGDIVGYGANPVECLDILESIKATVIKGNHEEALLTGDFAEFNTDAKIAMEWTRKNVPDKYLQKISMWKETMDIDDFIICHGGLNNPLHFYTNSRTKAKKMFDEFQFNYCFIGHTHFPMAFSLEKGSTTPAIIAEQADGRIHLIISPEKRFILNVGSVGQPRDGNPEACCGIYNTESRVFELHRIPYPTEIASKKIIDAGLPSSLAARISRGL
ncbi:MAG TPA: metallophosphoesterase family protein [bacterium]|nr:metallophosphoesterase family protein [bacterium]